MPSQRGAFSEGPRKVLRNGRGPCFSDVIVYEHELDECRVYAEAIGEGASTALAYIVIAHVDAEALCFS